MSSDQIVKEGYKQTEVGVIPEDWSVASLDSITSKIGDGIHSTPEYSSNEEYFFVNGNNLSNGGILITRSTKSVNYSEYTKYKINLNDRVLFLSINGTIGNVGIYHDEKIVLGKSIAYIEIKETYSRKYIYYLLQSTGVLTYFQDNLTGSTIKNLGIGVIKSTKVALPTKTEQTTIAKALSDTDTLITSLNALIHKKEQIKQGTMQQLLTGKIRLQGFGKGKGVKKTELGEISEDWEVVNISYLATIIMGQSPAGSSYNSSGKGVALINGPTEFTELYPVKKQWTTQPTKYCKKDDLLLCVRGSSTGRINISNDTYCIGRGVAAIRATNQSNTSYILYQLIQLIEKLLSKSTGSTFPSIDGKTIKSLLVTAPTKAEQTAIANVLTTIDTDIQTLKQRLEKTKSLKQGMMQELLTGKIRLIPPISGKIEAV